MPLTKLQFKSGISSDITAYSNEGGFIDGDKIRFRFGFPEKIGGWAKVSSNTYQGKARRLHNWIALDGSDYLGIGTHLKYYIEEGTTFNDITPIRSTITSGITFTTVNASAVVTVNLTNHGANANDFVTISAADAALAGLAASLFNKEHQIISITDSSKFTINLGSNASSAATGLAKGSGSVTANFQLNTGTDTTVGGTGWGAGQFGGLTNGALTTQLNEALDDSETAIDVDDETGITTAGDVILVGEELMLVAGDTDDNTLNVTRGHSGTTAVAHDDDTTVRLAVGNAITTDDFVGWGSSASVTVSGNQIRLWSHDNFGEDLIINAINSGIFYWDRTNGLATRAVELSTISGTKTSVPQIAKQIMVSDRDRHAIAFGADGLGATATATQGDGVQDPLLIRFSSQENPIDWFPTTRNTAGDLRLGGGSTFVQAVETKQEILVLTNKTLHSMKYIGPPFTFGIQELSKNITIMSPFSAIASGDAVYWMGIDTFYAYSGGQTSQLPCTIKDKIFLDINISEKDKVHVGVNSEFNEIIWFYPTAGQTEVDAYVIYNTSEQVWYNGTLSRDAWLDRGIRTLPIATGSTLIYNHEVGFDDDGSAMTAFVESAPMALGEGDRLASLSTVIPDVNFAGSTATNPSVNFTVKSRTHSGSGFTQTSDAKSSQRSATSPVEAYTQKLDFRVRGRTFSLRIESTALGTKFKLGTPLVNVVQDGRR
tara:strand:+ start:52 stop:2193 length:2142 start_codon:yes stop_codon:yes gene_type:complete